MSALARQAAAGVQAGLEVADVFGDYGHDYRRAHPLPPQHRKVMHDIESCRTAALGGHRERCDACGFERFAYNSCRNRHCPKCQTLTKAQWLDDRKADLLPVPYFHLVFTLPHLLNSILLSNMPKMLDILFQAASQTLLDFGRRNLGGKVGFIMILHTWDQKLGAHFHLHCLIPGGALAFDASRWIAASEGFLFPVLALGKVFRGKFIERLKQLFADGQLILPNDGGPLSTPDTFARLIDQLWQKQWVVYAKRSFAGPEQVLDYLGRYTHRVAISNNRILHVGNGNVTFRYRDRAKGDTSATMTVDAHEFIRRFLLHILPKGFMRIRYYGFLAGRCKTQDLQRCRQLLLDHDAEPPPRQRKTAAEWMLMLTGTDITCCPRCGARPLTRTRLLAVRPSTGASSPTPEVLDSS